MKHKATPDERRHARALMLAHEAECEVCAGPDDGCEIGQAIESLCLDTLKVDPWTPEKGKGRIRDGRIRDALTWVAQEARGVIMSGYVGPNHEKLRKALNQLEEAYNAPEATDD